MPSKMSRSRISNHGRQEKVQREIDTFLSAVHSYPDRFAMEPHLTFAEHLFRVTSAGFSFDMAEPRRRVH